MRLPGARLPVGEHRAVEAVEGPEDDVEGPGLSKGKRKRGGRGLERERERERERRRRRQRESVEVEKASLRLSSSFFFRLFHVLLLSLSSVLSLFSPLSYPLHLPGRRPPASSPCRGRRRRKTVFRFSFLFFVERGRESPGQGKSASLFVCHHPHPPFTSSIFLVHPITWLSPEPSPRSMTTCRFCRGV